MEGVFQIIRHHDHLAVREGEEGVFIERITDRATSPVLNRMGGFQRHPSAVGRVLLAYAALSRRR
ncbi:hypothetical protein A9W96_22975 [Mycobacterium sp. 1245852.3]|nr:hypothetical protein A9W96_22975 [Mycobacterium sp. 1245852.3]